MAIQQHKRRESEVIATTTVNDNFALGKFQVCVIARMCLNVENNG